MENKNFFAAVLLSMGFLYLWTAVIMPKLSPPRAAVNTPSTTSVSETSVTSSASPLQVSATGIRTQSATPVADQTLQDAQNEIVFSAQGAGVRHWFIHSKEGDVDLVLNPEGAVLPLASFPEAVFKMTASDRRMVMEATLEKGLRLTKTLSLAAEGHMHSLTYRFVNTSGQEIQLNNWEWGWGPGLGTTPSELKENPAMTRALSMGKLKVSVIKEGNTMELGQWAALDNRYFLVAFVPKTAGGAHVSASGKKDATQVRLMQNIRIPARGEMLLDYQIYAGPKGYTQLKTYNKHLEESVDFGWFTVVGHFLLSIIYSLKGFTGNYGYAIILVTILLNICLLPLTYKSFRATMAMKQLQPKIADLQQRFKTDPKRLQVEMMNLYKTSGTNPFGGCLPMILQIPIFVAFFNTLRNAYELRGAPFIGWIRDLSMPDKLPGLPAIHVLPLIMGAVMFVQQRMTGAVTDPMQKQMMMIMPVMFTFMLYTMPSGLVIYWLTNSLVTILFQYIFIKTHEKPGAGTPQSPIVERH